MTDSCATCCFSRTAPTDAGAPFAGNLFCCHSAPRADNTNPSAWMWPLVMPGWWCADGAAKTSGLSYSNVVTGLPSGQQGPQGGTGLTGPTGPQGLPGAGFDNACLTYRDRTTTTTATPVVVRSVALPINSEYWIDVVAQFVDTATHLLGGYSWATLSFSRGTGSLVAIGTTDILESHNLAGPALTLIGNTLTNSVDITLTGKAATSLAWTVRTLVDTG